MLPTFPSARAGQVTGLTIAVVVAQVARQAITEERACLWHWVWSARDQLVGLQGQPLRRSAEGAADTATIRDRGCH